MTIIRKTSLAYKKKTVITVGKVIIENNNNNAPENNSFIIIAGPCSIENKEMMEIIAEHIKKSADILRAGAFKPRSDPYSFQGMGEDGLKILKKVSEHTKLPTITECMSIEQLPLIEKYADIIQVGARNMQNFELLKAVGKSKLPVLLKRGLSATIDEWLGAAEYIMNGGNEKVILCERGIRSFDSTYSRNVLDLSVVPILRTLTHLPIIIDPSHAAGRRDIIIPLCVAAQAIGADGIIVEVHNEPDKALCDGKQSLTLEMYEDLIKKLREGK